MTPPCPRTRRQILALLASTALGSTLRRAGAGPLDQGIGGTGAAPPIDASDRGIGGTGVIGTIRKFGSIVVNDLRIAYPPDAAIYIDGRPASAADLRIGQVVRVDAMGGRGALSTRTIDVTSEVVGDVERVGSRQITVLGQTVSTAGLGRSSIRPGDTVAVSGLRRNDGTIVASLIERRDGAVDRVAGPVRLGEDGGLRIGSLRLNGLDPSLIDRRAIVEGRREGDHFTVSRAASEASLLPNVRTLSIESYVERRGDRLVLGSGLRVEDADRLTLSGGGSIRAVLTTIVAPDGRLSVESVRANGRGIGTAPGGTGAHGGPGTDRGGDGRAPAAGSNGRIPMNFDRGGLNGTQSPSDRGFGGGSGGGGSGGGFGAPGGASGGPGGQGGPFGGFGGPAGGGGQGGRR